MGDLNGTNGVNGVNGTDDVHDEIRLPNAESVQPTPGLTIQPPPTRRGYGPGLVLLVPEGLDVGFSDKTLDPPPLQKWAEEGFAVAQVTKNKSNHGIADQMQDALDCLRQCPGFDGTEKFGLISYNIEPSDALVSTIDSTAEIVAVVVYGDFVLDASKEQIWHSPGGSPSKRTPSDNKSLTQTKTFTYPDASGPFFPIPAHDDFRSAAAAVSHTRCLSFLKPLVGGPWFDLEAIWDEHTKFEFGERAVEKTMATMVQEPYVNHVPTITGGIGRQKLTEFYRNHFVFNNPDDTAMELVSRTVGIDRVIDEFVFRFTHDRMIDWLAPGIPPTGKSCELPFTGVINIRGDRLYHEHIGWDGATLLRQLGLMPEYLPFPYAINGKKAPEGKTYEYRVPTAGVETSRKLVDERSIESNQMFEFGIREVDKR